MVGRPDGLDELYTVMPKDFTSARRAVVARLREQGQQTEAVAVMRLRKPTAVVWAINRLASADPAALSALLDAARRLKAAQLTRPDDLRAAAQTHRTALQSLMKRARTLVGQAGTAPSPVVVRRLSATLLGAAADPALAEQLRHGRLTAEQSAPGFEVFGGQMPAGPSPAAPTTPPRRRTATPTRLQPVESRQAQRAEEARRAREERDAAQVAAREQAARRREAQQLARTAAQRRRAATETARALEEACAIGAIGSRGPPWPTSEMES